MEEHKKKNIEELKENELDTVSGGVGFLDPILKMFKHLQEKLKK